jgi:3',5'-cyclic AMP phosphodiesterase CpdA
MNTDMNRRQMLASAVAAGLVPAMAAAGVRELSQPGAATQPAAGGMAPQRTIRIAHLTDMHVQPELRAGEGFGACLEHMMALKDRPELVLGGGDHVMDTFEHDDAHAKKLWELYHKVLKDHTTLRVESCIGNHDIFGWNKGSSKTTGSEPNWGKKRAIDELGIGKPYRKFDLGSWRFIVLDTVQPDPEDPNGYLGGLDDEQFAWLRDVLEKTDTRLPVLVLSHVPIMHAAATLFNGTIKKKQHEISGGTMCLDNLRIVDLFSRHKNVKLCLSGHIHNLERIDFQGVTYVCNGAVSGNWWQGNKPNDKPHTDRAVEGYAVMDLYEDGSFTHKYETYGWKA